MITAELVMVCLFGIGVLMIIAGFWIHLGDRAAAKRGRYKRLK